MWEGELDIVWQQVSNGEGREECECVSREGGGGGGGGEGGGGRRRGGGEVRREILSLHAHTEPV